MKRLSVSLPPEIEKTIIDLRKTDEFCMCSCADILRHLMTTTTLLADCVEKLSKEINPAQSTYITAKIATCLEILKLFH